MISRLARIVTHRRLPWALGLLAVALTLPAIATGFQFDDYLLRATLRGPGGPAALPAALSKPFVFMDGNAAHSAVLMASGVYPWWAVPGWAPVERSLTPAAARDRSARQGPPVGWGGR